MSQASSIAPALGWNFAIALMVCIAIFHAGNGEKFPRLFAADGFRE